MRSRLMPALTFATCTIACSAAIALIAGDSRVFACAIAAPNAGDASPIATESLITACMSDDPAVASVAIAQLRSIGQPAVDALCDEHRRLMKEFIETESRTMDAQATFKSTRASPADLLAATADEREPRIAQLRSAIDSVAMQRDAYASRLFWHTDFDGAKSQAIASGKPILSLRMLGNLNDDLSCANSRYFRSILYPDAQVSEYLREHFVLHWESLRPVPRLTIEFGDGRRIERTITGNSIHYVLDAHGEVIDALPGLYGPAAFLRGLQAAEQAVFRAATLSDADAFARSRFLQRYHSDAIQAIDLQLSNDRKQLQATDDDAAAKARANGARVPSPAPTIAGRDSSGELSDELLARLAQLHAADATLDHNSVMLIRSKVPEDFLKIAERAQGVAISKSGPEAPVVAMLRTLNRSVAQDTIRNEYVIHHRIHNMLRERQEAPKNQDFVTAFNGRVYAELFHTPLDDPWMGLAPRDAYTAIDDGGLIEACR